jgi:hypothetical protein
VLPVEKTELTLQLVTVLITSITPPTLVKNVLTNVPNVLVLNLLVTLVPLIELTNQLVTVQLDIMISQKKLNVNHVMLNVSLAQELLNIVLFVLETDFLHQIVPVHQIT